MLSTVPTVSPAWRLLWSPLWLLAMIVAACAAWTPAVVAEAPAAGAAAPPAAIDFNRDIRPILSENCFFCHGPDANLREADLRLDTAAGAIGRAIEPGDAAASELMGRVTSDDDALLMPPADSGRQLTEAQIELLRRWIDDGAVYQQHWSLVPPRAQVPPEQASPELAALNASSTDRQAEFWGSHPVDRFIWRGLSEQQLTAGPPADRQTLIRRVTLDLTGLPPTLEEIDRFLADSSPLAYEQLVDRLLASPAFGERMAADWLDVARYSDSYGMQVDKDRRVWPYRDWVIAAFNQGMPYDQFLIQQLAGDLLPGATSDQILATTFNRLHPQESEGGSVPEEFLAEYRADRVQTVGTAFLGLTLECCRCHDHKYDPLSQQEYFQLLSFFDNIDEAGLYSFFTDAVPTPTLDLPSAAQQQTLATQRQELEVVQTQNAEQVDQLTDEFQQWLAGQSAAGSPASQAAASAAGGAAEQAARLSVGAAALPGQVAHLSFDDWPLSESDALSGSDVSTNRGMPGVVGRAVRLGGDEAIEVGVGNFPRWQPFTVALWLQVDRDWDRAVVFHRSRAWTDAASRGYELLIVDGHLQASLVHFWPGDQVSVRSRHRLPLDRWQHVSVSWDGSGRAAGLRLYVDGQLQPVEVIRDQLTRRITGGGGDTLQIGARFRDRGLTGGLVDEFRVFDRRLSQLEIAELHQPGSLTATLAAAALAAVSPPAVAPAEDVPAASAVAASDPAAADVAATTLDTAPSGGSPGRQQQLWEHYLLAVSDRQGQHRQRLQAARQAVAQTVDGIEQIMVMRELAAPAPTYLLQRGQYDALGPQVGSATPAALPPWPDSLPADRLGLARWMCHPDHPLTSRVAANRLWQTLFGRGLVDTPEDFGNQGSPPSHPELLDWLARWLVDHDWDIKAFARLLVTSATYRQAAGAVSEQDPENIYLGRAAQYRWPAEMLRDQALLVSGLLSHRLGGPPVRPYEVETAFKPVPRDRGEGLHRRSLYTYWNRTGPAPALTTLDASLRDVCRVKREQTSTPLQALVIWNSPQFVEAARELAQQLMLAHPLLADSTASLSDEAAAALRAALGQLFRQLTSQQPDDEQLALLLQLYHQQHALFAASPDQAQAWLAVGDRPADDRLDRVALAALASVANALLNYDGSVMKH